MNTDKLNADFMDMMEIALNNTQNLANQREIIELQRQFKDHLNEVDDAISEKGVLSHG
ncbi:hypothetical protein ACFP7A_08975 [Sporolactobacillus kofuensis]|uniref:Phage protein n=1 Tax=Sporolactobacillus kofuensis TaxID=269672 RepID=A0ABW1WI19_9BACL|nr:hypothetical protein [Sporolactobacillus kofuensis]MCO7176144.1 hypothetical protein [Sporolactobacillus kofuensis]